MKLILQIAAGIVLGGAVLMTAVGLIAEHLGLRIARDVAAALDRATELQKTQLDFFEEQLALMEAQRAQISTEIQMAKLALRRRLDARPPAPTPEPTPAPAAAEPAAPTAQPAPAEERQIIARGGNAPASLEEAPAAGPEEARRKEEAWARFYDKPDDCEFIVDQASMVRCGNHHIVRRREFEQLWEQGMIE